MNADKLSFNFAFATDLHIEANACPDVPEANARVYCLLDDVKELTLELNRTMARIGDIPLHKIN